jgi:hypothetical protein
MTSALLSLWLVVVSFLQRPKQPLDQLTRVVLHRVTDSQRFEQIHSAFNALSLGYPRLRFGEPRAQLGLRYAEFFPNLSE